MSQPNVQPEVIRPEVDKTGVAATEHHAGEGYSGHRAVPNVQRYREERDARQIKADEYAKSKDGEEPAKSGQEEKEELMARMGKEKGKPTDLKSGGDRRVKDPVTGQMVIVHDADLNTEQRNKKTDKSSAGVAGGHDSRSLDPEDTDHPGPSMNKPPNHEGQDIINPAPHPAAPGNICLQTFPPPVEASDLKPILASLNTVSIIFAGSLGVVLVLFYFGSTWKQFVVRAAVLGTIGVGSVAAVGVYTNRLTKDLERVRFNMHKQRGENFSPPTPESVEWLNAILATAWPLVDPGVFTSIADQIEDVMQASLPKFVDAVKVDDLSQGKNPLRIISMRGLPDRMDNPKHPQEEWITGGKATEDKSLNEDDNAGDYLNLEVALSYQAQPGQGSESKLRENNMHLMIEFFLGIYDWFHIPIPIWITVEALVLTARIRLQMIPGPAPRNLTFTLMGIPVVEVSAIPMAKALPNVLNLPLISGFVKSSIAAAANEYVAPKSMTLNLGQMLAGDGIKKDTDALGVICVTIHHAEGLSAQDRSGSSDPYIVVAFAKFGKPLYSTRIIFQDLNPVFEETCFLLVSQDEVNSDEDLSLQLWDSDKRTADDLIGRINVPLKEVMGTKNEMKTRKDPLKGFQDADDMSGHLTWSVGYFEKAKLNRKLTKDEGQNASLPKEAKESAAPPPQGTQVDSNEEKLALSTPPDPRYHSGILSIIVEHINNLEFQNLKGASGSDRGEGAAGQDTDDPSEQGKNLPSAYAEIVINDDLVYKTRTKQYTSMPLFNAGCERFIRDWQNTIVRIVVRSARLREHDPIMGVINFPLKDLLKDSSQVSRLFSLQEGIGFGRAKISVLFKAVEAELPAPLRGWETGTVEILSDVKLEVQNKEHADTLAGKKLTIRTNATSTKLPPASASVNERGEVIFDVSNMIRLPVYERFSTPLLFEFGSGSSLPGMKSGPYAVAALWLQDVEDDREMDIRVPILLGKNTQQLRQNYNNEFLAKSHEHEVIGHLICKFQLDSGLDPAHEQYIDSQTARHEYEAFDRIEGQARIAEMNSHAADDGVIDKKEQKEIDKANKHALQSRQRGTYQYAPVRTSVWAKDGVKSRLRKLTGKSSRAQTVETEA